MMACASATFPEVTCFDDRIASRGDLHRVVLRGIVTGLAALAAVSVTVACVTAAAGWILATVLSANADLHTRAPIGLGTAALVDPYPELADTGDLGGLTPAPTEPADAANFSFQAQLEAEMPRPAAAAISAPVIAALLAPHSALEITQSVPTPTPRPLGGPHGPAKPDVTRLPVGQPAPQVATTAPPPPTASPQKPSFTREARLDTTAPPESDSRTAVYDIEAHTVYLPDGEKLEAHSGLGDKLDDPRYVNVRDRGPTPPNVYA